MDKDRKVIYEIISEMLDNPDEHGIYPTTRAYDRLEQLIEAARNEGRAELDVKYNPSTLSGSSFVAAKQED